MVALAIVLFVLCLLFLMVLILRSYKSDKPKGDSTDGK